MLLYHRNQFLQDNYLQKTEEIFLKLFLREKFQNINLLYVEIVRHGMIFWMKMEKFLMKRGCLKKWLKSYFMIWSNDLESSPNLGRR